MAAVKDGAVVLRCPLSGREIEWATYCYLAEELPEGEWPLRDARDGGA